MDRAPFLLALLTLLLSGSAQAAEPSVRAQPERVVLGRTESVRLVVTGFPPDGAGTAPVRGHANVGTLQRLAAEPGEVWEWRPPTQHFPQTALFVFWRNVGEEPSLATFELPLIGRTELSVDTEPQAQVRVEVAGRTFGPVKATDGGKARVLVEVPPATKEARVLAEVHGHRTNRTVVLNVPPSARTSAVILDQPIDAERGGWLVVTGADTRDRSAFAPRVEGGRALLVRSGSDRALFRLLPEAGATNLRVAIPARGTTAELTLEAEVSAPKPTLPPPPPTTPVAANPSATAGAGRLSGASAHTALGFFLADGRNRGLALELGAAWPVPVLARRLHLEVFVGYRGSGLSLAAPELGTLRTSVRSMPLGVAGRFRVFQRSLWHVDSRGGVGLQLFRQSSSADFQPDFAEGGTGVLAFAGAQAGRQLGPMELFLELRGDWAPARTSHVRAFMGGFGAQLGARYVLR